MAGANAELLDVVEGTVNFRVVQTAPDARLVFIGDIHGCHDEVVELLTRVAPAGNDVVVSVGDIVTKGPAAARCLDLWRERGFLAVRGNNENKVLASAHPLLRFVARENRDVLRRRDLLRYIASWPVVIDFPEQKVAAVHGGFLPGMAVNASEVEREQDVLPKLRWIRRTNQGWVHVPKQQKKSDDVLWAEKWKGDRFAVYGHTPLRQPKFDPQALGLDTGCVYGGSLTAAVYAGGQWTTVSVPARRRYAD